MLGGMVQVCLNGSRNAAGSGVVPMTPAELADAAGKAVAAGARDIHVHPRSPCGRESLMPGVLTPVLEAIRAVVDVPVGVTTGAWAEPDPARRVACVRAWPVLPDHASVNWHEPGAEAVAAALLERGVGVEAGIWSGTDGAERFAAAPLGPRVLRVLAEVMDPCTASARQTARGLLRALDAYGAHGRPVLLHGEDGGAWPVLRLAGELGLATRIGVEDTLLLPDGSPAASNAELVRAALREREAGARPPGREPTARTPERVPEARTPEREAESRIPERTPEAPTPAARPPERAARSGAGEGGPGAATGQDRPQPGDAGLRPGSGGALPRGR